ncbi:MAG: hypothetical protein RIS92_1714 [Verrucomicrobiota bacterium]
MRSRLRDGLRASMTMGIADRRGSRDETRAGLIAGLDACAFERGGLAFLDERGERGIEFSDEAVEALVVVREGVSERAIGGGSAHVFVEFGELWVAESDVFHLAKPDSGEQIASGLRRGVRLCESDFLVLNKAWGAFDVFEIGESLEQYSINGGKLPGIGGISFWRETLGRRVFRRLERLCGCERIGGKGFRKGIPERESGLLAGCGRQI